MLDLIGDEEVNYILDGRTIEEITSRAITTYRRRPGFFTPYKNGYEFLGELTAPGLYPFSGLVLAGYSACAFVISAVACLGALLVAGSAVLFKAATLKNDALVFASFALKFTGIALLTSAIGALLAIISFPHSLISVGTRSLATLSDLGKKISVEDQNPRLDEIEMNTLSMPQI